MVGQALVVGLSAFLVLCSHAFLVWSASNEGPFWGAYFMLAGACLLAAASILAVLGQGG